MTFCRNCGHELALGNEKFCPQCGINLEGKGSGDAISSKINNTKGDVVGTGVAGTGNFVGKEIGYTVHGNVINIQLGGSVSREVLDTLQRILAVPTQVEPTTNDKNNATVQESGAAHQQIKSILYEVNRIEKNTGTEVREIKAGDLQISKNELSLREIILKGNEYYYKKEYEIALEWYNKALEIDPKNARAWNNKGIVLAVLALEKYKEAIGLFDKALEIDPKDARAWNNKGILLANLEKYKEAIGLFDKALEIDPRDAEAWNNKGLALSNLGNYKEAIECYDKVLEIDPKDARAWNNKGLALSNLRNYKEAIGLFDKALEIDPKDASPWGNKGFALSNLGNYKEAIECYDKVLEIDPKDAEACYYKGFARGKLER
jgi:Flp pilus assembly protein TadD